MSDSSPWRLVSSDDFQVLIDKDVVRPADTDAMNLVLALAHLHNTVDDATRVGGQRSFSRRICVRSADDRAGARTVARRDLTDVL